MKGTFTAAKSRHVLILILTVFFLTDAARSQQRWQLHASPQDKSPGTAQVLSLIGTAIPFGLMAAAFAQKDGWDGLNHIVIWFWGSAGSGLIFAIMIPFNHRQEA
jgi:hypothetical protein